MLFAQLNQLICILCTNKNGGFKYIVPELNQDTLFNQDTVFNRDTVFNQDTLFNQDAVFNRDAVFNQDASICPIMK